MLHSCNPGKFIGMVSYGGWAYHVPSVYILDFKACTDLRGQPEVLPWAQSR